MTSNSWEAVRIIIVDPASVRRQKKAGDMDKLRIFIADDHAMIRHGLQLLLDAQPDMKVVGEANDGKSAVRLVLEQEPDVVVIDICIPRVEWAAGDRTVKEGAPTRENLNSHCP